MWQRPHVTAGVNHRISIRAILLRGLPTEQERVKEDVLLYLVSLVIVLRSREALLELGR